MSVKTNRLQSNLLQQNVYVRDCVESPVDLRRGFIPCTYFSLDQVVQDDGVKEVLTEHEYPVTPESVNSYVSSCDYRLDPAGAIAGSVKRQNLGDVRAMQDVSKMDADQAQALLSSLQARLAVLQSSAKIDENIVKDKVEGN